MLALLALPLIALFCTSARAAFGWSQENGRTRLIGTSFGILGKDYTFDYVKVVGGGTAGLTIASRLAENPSISVAVIEAGGFYELDNCNISQIPAYGPEYSTSNTKDPLSIQPLVDWGDITIPQPQLGGRQIHYAQGKCLGGSSGRNYMGYNRYMNFPIRQSFLIDDENSGTLGTYHRWADQLGDQSFTFENLLKYFQKSPQFTLPIRPEGSQVNVDQAAFSPTGGPLQVSYSNEVKPLTKFVEQAYLQLGIRAIPGQNSGRLIGYAEFALTLDQKAGGLRSSSESSFLQQAIADTPLLVYKNTLAKQILFDDNKKAIGVKVDTAGVGYTLTARQEVILSAGTFRSPQLLMASGIGPSATLKQIGVQELSDLPGVGQNLQDQPYFQILYKVNLTTNSELFFDPEYVIEATEEFLTEHTGPLTSEGETLVAFEKLPSHLRSGLSNSTIKDISTFPSDWPDVELLVQAYNTTAVPTRGNYASFGVATHTLTSRGNVTVKSADTADRPLVNPAWLFTKTDQELAVQAFKRAREVAKATRVTVGAEVIPGPQAQSYEQILDYIKSSVDPFRHVAGTYALAEKFADEILSGKKNHKRQHIRGRNALVAHAKS
ncbi:uncharacterized protein KY384_004136 [Bacidia gigantensis]|uniref:uncharacterized protein n=1 Tax=Bacidia gigantensis TaxID=2732470 RepID=UPI001D052E01|nr:uncharacterized protein KY384_004136 [Bacidia gigantensis]KAG8530779.1 hypothetical protein KY384_004136 [Bacidia gigantensis]